MLDIEFDDRDEDLKQILEESRVVSNRCIRTEHERLKIPVKKGRKARKKK